MVFDIIGISGVVVILITYYLLQTARLRYDDYSFLFLNIVGSMFILISLFNAFNLAAAVIEVAWIAISIFGLMKRWRRGQDIEPG